MYNSGLTGNHMVGYNIERCHF